MFHGTVDIIFIGIFLSYAIITFSLGIIVLLKKEKDMKEKNFTLILAFVSFVASVIMLIKELLG